MITCKLHYKASTYMLISQHYMDDKPASLGSRVNTFLLVTCYLLLFLGSSSARAVTVTSGPALSMDPGGLTPLAGVVQFETDMPARVTLAVSDGKETRTIEFAEYKTDFSLPLLGLKPDRNYTIEVILTDLNNQQSTLTPALKATTAPLPDDFPEIKVLVSKPALMEPGYTMMARFIPAGGNREVTLAGYSTGLTKQKLREWMCWAISWATECEPESKTTYTIIVDSAGDVVWYSTLGDTTNYQLEDGSLLYRTKNDVINIDMLGNEISHVTMKDPGIGLTHDMYPTTNQTYLSITIQQVMIQDYPTSYTDPDAERKPAKVEDNPIVEFDHEGNLLHIWPLVDMLDTGRINYHSLVVRPDGDGYDWVHGNAVINDPRDDSIIISLRHQDAVVKFSRSTGELKWILGPHANWSQKFQPFLLKPVGEPFEWQYHQHSPVITPAGTLLLFDNGNYRARPFDGFSATTAGKVSLGRIGLN